METTGNEFSGLREQAVQHAQSGQQEAPQAAPENKSFEQVAPTTTPKVAEAPSLQDISKLEKFLLEGKETTYKDLKAERMRYSDYTKKTQELSQERKFYSNLPIDLSAVKSNPALAQEFKRVYPQQFHAYLDFVLAQEREQPEDTHEEPQRGFDPKNIEQIVNKMVEARVAPVENHFKEERVKAEEAKLEVIFKTMSQKYPLADEETVLARAQAMHNQGYELNDEAWDRLFKTTNDRHQKLYEDHYKAKITEQKKANVAAKDVTAGGGIPGEAPKKMSLKDVQKQMLEDLKNGRAG